MVKVCTNGQMGANTQATSSKTKDMAMEFTLTQIIDAIKANSKTAYNMV